MSRLNWRIILTVIIIGASLFAFRHTYDLWTITDEGIEAMEKEKAGSYLQLQKDAIRFGLDLQGGIHVVLKVDSSKAEGRLDDAVERAIEIIRNRIDELGVAEPIIVKEGNDRILVELPGYTDANRAEELIGQTALLEFKLLETMENTNIILNKMDSVIHEYEVAKKAEGSGSDDASKEPEETAEMDSTKQAMIAEMMGSTTDSSDTSGADDPFAYDETVDMSLNEKPMSTRMTVALYNSETNASWPGFEVGVEDKKMFEEWLALPNVQSLIPVDVQVCWSTRSEINENQREVYSLYFVKRKVQFLGRFLENVALSQESFGKYVVTFTLSGDGSDRFSSLTGTNINKPLAIVLDNRVESAPFIQGKIRGRGQISMGGSATLTDAKNMEIVLKAGSLPVPVEIIEKNVVGATLGADSIKKGFYSSLIGLAIVLLYIAIYYRISGVIADIGLIFNIFFLLAVMAGLGATLTMPGIAGIILTIGISVDANILIFERIREELRTGKTVRASIDAGYERAFVAIFDSHVTTLITAGALFLFGSGPIKGFAVTLFWGVTISLYTAYIITKQIFDIRKGYRKLSI